MQSALLVSIALISLSACRKPSALERQLIGTWERPEVEILYSADNDYRAPDSVMQVTFTPDHKEVWSVPGKDVHAVARWHVEGNDLVFTMETEAFTGPAGTTKRERVTKITSDELVFTEGNAEGDWKRVR